MPYKSFAVSSEDIVYPRRHRQKRIVKMEAMMELNVQWRQLELLMNNDEEVIRSQRLKALDQTEITILLTLLLAECVVGASKAIGVEHEQDHS
jgi:hypothetical protein